ncbi:uncharacterized protein LOC127637930 isoform X9 [Xyrauchen texanus]|uniref:uncharacterized protein LOC127637930 isoform X9 n=1 Tax=Xyrauchen texanus TaxID=154827 RepID=UPI002242B13D|nr:uncharacterized protein LOC127637930 isoform X9 [Xyrauchen texanus]
MSMAAVRRVVKKVQASRTLPESRCVVDCKRQQWKRSRSLSQTKWMQLKCHCFYTKRITEGFCDSQRRFCHVSVGHPGSWHDSRAYRLSEWRDLVALLGEAVLGSLWPVQLRTSAL